MTSRCSERRGHRLRSAGRRHHNAKTPHRARADALSQRRPDALLPLGALESLALPGETYKLAFTPGLLTQVYGDRVTEAMLATDGGYVHSEGEATWWIPSGRVVLLPTGDRYTGPGARFARQHFFLPHRSRDPFGNTAFRATTLNLLPVQTTDALGNRTTADWITASCSHFASPTPTATAPDGSVDRPQFNSRRTCLSKVEVHLRGVAMSTPFVTNIDYDAKGQRVRMDCGWAGGLLVTLRAFRMASICTSTWAANRAR